MRVLTFLHSFEPGGVERVALRLVRRWREEGVDAPLFMGRTTGPMRTELAEGLGFDTPRHPVVSTHWWETSWMIATLPAFIRRTAPDVLFCAGNSYAIVAVAMKLILGRRCPPIVAKVSNDLDRRDMIWPVRILYHRWLWIQGRVIDHFVGMEDAMAEEIAHAMQVPHRKISIIPDPALSRRQCDSLRAMRPYPLPAAGAGTRFVSVGRLAPQKNFALMLDAFAAAARSIDTLVIYGDGPCRSSLMRQIVRLGLSQRVTLAGHVADPASRLFDFDAFLLSSNFEGVPAVLLEALAVGLPIITTRCSRSMTGLMMDGRLASMVPTGDTAAFARAIGGAAALRQDLMASADQARRFTIETAASRYVSAFASIAPPLADRETNISATS